MMFKSIEIFRLGLISVVIVLLAGITNGCEEQLDLNPLSETEADFFKETIDFERAGMGMYAKLSDIYSYWGVHNVWLLPGDDVTSTAPYPFEVFTMSSGTTDNDRYYTPLYQIVNRANTLLEKILEDEESGDPVFLNTTPRNRLKGEAYFLRGWADFHLWNYYGTSPNITERISTREGINPPGSGKMELLDQAISDFRKSAEMLPDVWNETDRGRATKSSANGYLGKALVFKANATGDAVNYNQAIQVFETIKDKTLVANYGDNFSAYSENNSESLFEYQAAENGADNVWLSNDDFPVGTYSAYYGYFDGRMWFGFPLFVASPKLNNTLDHLDPRLPHIMDTITGQIKKYVLQDVIGNTGAGSLNNTRLLRYADILLLKAEAINETGDQDGAIALINQVRARARNMGTAGIPADFETGAERDQVRQWIMEERFIELAAEAGHRWLDLRRWHMAGWINLATWDFSSLSTSFHIEMDKHLFWPIPISETERNPNVKQNDGY